MPGRVLNFLEFSDKYSNGSSEPLSVDAMTGASANFEEGFDETTYDQPELGPKRPVSGEYEATPAPDASAISFGQDNSPEMNAPEESEESEEPEELEEGEEESEETDEDEESDETDEEEEEDEKDLGNPEESNENFTLVKGFARFVNESMLEHPEVCTKCGEDIEEDEYGSSCGCNM